jgi:1-deoxy-D-xylulose-5-phosphate synthase
MDEVELRQLMYTAQLEHNKMPFSIRYPRGCGVIADWEKPFEELEIGKARLIADGGDLAVLSIGHPGNFVKEAAAILKAENITFTHWDMRFVAPIDKEALHSVFSRFKKVLTIEDGILKGGFGSAVLEFMCDNKYNSTVKRLGIPDFFIEQGTQQELQHECGFDTEGIVKAVREMMA